MVAGMAVEIVEYLLVNDFAEDGAGGAACRTTDQAGNHGSRSRAADSASRTGQQTDRGARFRTGQCERDAAGGSCDGADRAARLAC